MAVSDKIAQDLEEAMEAGLEELADLAAATEREHDALVRSDHDAFGACADEKDQALAAFTRRQNDIIELLQRAGAELGRSAGQITLSAIRESLPEAPRERLDRLAAEMERRLQTLQEGAAQNAEMIRNTLAYYDFLANLIIDTFTDQPEYGPKPKAGRTRPLMVDRSA